MYAREKLTELFIKFPGIGPRQAQRFVQFLLKASPTVRDELIEALRDISLHAHQCPECQRFHEDSDRVCNRCHSRKESTTLLVVATDTDADAIERTRLYDGTYFILGGTVTLGADTQPHLREASLAQIAKKKGAQGLTEVILAFPANPEGDMTAARVRDVVRTSAPHVRITTLGRGLSTGSEIEYADADTIRSALEGRRE